MVAPTLKLVIMHLDVPTCHKLNANRRKISHTYTNKQTYRASWHRTTSSDNLVVNAALRRATEGGENVDQLQILLKTFCGRLLSNYFQNFTIWRIDFSMNSKPVHICEVILPPVNRKFLSPHSDFSRCIYVCEIHLLLPMHRIQFKQSKYWNKNAQFRE